ncbi:MAG: Maltose O-acetyltransferase [Candidatus Moranbacteria bacterium GW2011_GWE1_36_7]|nr:MAG: Maltose O-acetyltransferase [Candidatus Moranbacteria bacterium GW2011_GWD2_36_12]KKQ05804.1 MAG: Maltose O-acetyltransferase [Candidatus Moranbacteria bacterium GW2011_GWE2_36_40]KKQ12373.1 MAG: Maltose O-acetyltransferase [Candidatus Moranbacteria bacterium GW2011_GWE1_36_7]
MKNFFKKNEKQEIKKTSPVTEELLIPGTVLIGNAHFLKIGKNVSFGGNVILYANAPIEIGDHTMIAINVILHTSTHDINKHPMWENRVDKPIKVGSHVWIGAAAIILPGIIIEDFSVVGAGCIVTANVPMGAIVAGNPARIIGYRDDKIYKNRQSICNSEKATIVNGGHIDKYCKMK